MRPWTTVLKGALGSAFHATDVVRDPSRGRPVPPVPDRASFTIADIAHWYVPERTEYLVRTIDALRAQEGAVSILIITNEPEPALAARGPRGAAAPRFDDPSAAAAHLLDHPGSMASLSWSPPRRRTHPFELTWAHKALMRSIALEHAGFDHGLSHLLHVEDDMELSSGALAYWARARPVLEPHGLLPGFSRWEGRGGARNSTDQTRRVHLASAASVEAPLASDGDERVLWVNLPNPHQGCFVLDAALAARNLTTSRYLSPARSLSG